ncbi:MAG: 2OG-Fe(II) oxygenase [Candidatus Cyclonatronum sp.]|uniref:2OG-Fe(II) oxygenase n=1 Tax=Cyclonatronum sp. TaxID=3024185 RepID=UPI0025B8F6F6|nr:2OG-Fe(II) oxygenase [Cyclonatronum sp.]MCC5934846.1 2OG-Fe(II) oxygenase [Balneolales bacterium]MCH8488060.1 2OG-Fe(II) oxygenase [Cyclonatronum sp.]
MDDSLLTRIADEIAEKGWSITDHFLPDMLLRTLVTEAETIWDSGEFSRAGIGAGSNLALRPEIRSDRVHWLEPGRLTPAQQQYWDTIDTLRETLNRTLFLSARSFEAHLAVYPPGSFYKKHLDQHAEVQHRLISCILYLNEGWVETDGGYLRIYHQSDESGFTDVLPLWGRFACFRSDLIFHEVLPGTRERFSLTGWLRREALF